MPWKRDKRSVVTNANKKNFTSRICAKNKRPTSGLGSEVFAMRWWRPIRPNDAEIQDQYEKTTTTNGIATTTTPPGIGGGAPHHHNKWESKMRSSKINSRINNQPSPLERQQTDYGSPLRKRRKTTPSSDEVAVEEAVGAAVASLTTTTTAPATGNATNLGSARVLTEARCG